MMTADELWVPHLPPSQRNHAGQRRSVPLAQDNRPTSLSARTASADPRFTIAIVTALRLEYDALAAALDSPPEVLPHDLDDPFIFTTGVFAGRNVVISYPAKTGQRDTALAVQFLELKYGKMRLVILLGICAGIPKPPEGDEIFLGDVVISTAVLAYAHGARLDPTGLQLRKILPHEAGGTIRQVLELIRTDSFSRQLTDVSRGALEKLRHQPHYRPLPENKDLFFDPSYHHLHRPPCPANICNANAPDNTICESAKRTSCRLLQCDKTQARPRPPYSERPFGIHCGVFASADLIMRDAQVRDGLANEYGVLAFDMEATGIWGLNPHIVVIKGVCDYGDSHKPKDWQDFAAARAACVAIAFITKFFPQGNNDF
ncbi:purine and uridine phosphorylase [Periconia macrospinosa]|uniref:Purine and uridine phosphorylase n=1 Tax=Periconia macrospinosa TaxID=97972 RepID=A0A2V1DIX4_9PLEO|nr:purine and uridine phosphorylase [Periconia macrospinosa]